MSARRLNQGAASGLLALALVGLLSGCSIFGSSSAPKPAALETLPAGSARVLWSARTESLGYPLSIATPGELFVVAGGDGTVQAFQADSGALAWRGEVGAKLAAGVGSDGRHAAVVTRGGELVVLDGGKLLWRKPLGTPVVAAPLVAGERVFVLSVDRAVFAFDVKDGRRLWDLRRPGDALTLAQPGVIAAYKDTLVVGQGARLAGVDPLRGTLRWDADVGNPRGTNEVERLADAVAPLWRSGAVLCARAFQAAVGCVNAEKGNTLWIRNAGGTQGLGGDAEMVFGADASDRVSAWKLASGDTAWSAEQLLNRKLSAPLALGDAVLVGDAEGYVHFLSRETGKTQQRIATDGSAIAAAPVRIGDTALVATRNGGLYALRAR